MGLGLATEDATFPEWDEEDSMIMSSEGIFEFLAVLIIDFDQVRVQVLGKEVLSSLEGVFSIIPAEESHQGVMLDKPINGRSAMDSKKDGHNGETNRNEKQSNRDNALTARRHVTLRIPAGNSMESLQMLEEREAIMGDSLEDKPT
ncbi:hypothetical protein ACLOJK_014934 [Asimina triloba]